MPHCYNCGRHVDGPEDNCRFCGWEYTDQWEEPAEPEVAVKYMRRQPGCYSCCLPGCFWIVFIYLMMSYLLREIWDWLF